MGLVTQRALERWAALELGVHVGLDDIRASEFYAMLIIEEVRERSRREKLDLKHKPF